MVYSLATPEPASSSSASLIPAARLQGLGSRTSQDEPLNHGSQQARESTRCACQSRRTIPCLVVQVEALPRGLPCRGLGVLSPRRQVCQASRCSAPTPWDPAGKPPDAELTGLPEQCPTGGQSSLSLFSVPGWHPGLSQAPSPRPTSPSATSHPAPTTLAFSQPFLHPKLQPASAPLHVLFPLPGTPRLAPSLPSGLSLGAPSSERPSPDHPI